MNSTCLSRRLVRIAVRSPLICSVGPEVCWNADAQLVGDDVGQRRLAQSRRPVEQNVVQRFAARLGRLDGDFEIVFDLVLADELAQPLRPQLEFKR